MKSTSYLGSTYLSLPKNISIYASQKVVDLSHDLLIFNIYIYIFIYACVYVCVF